MDKTSAATKEFCAEYQHKGKTWGINFFAEDEDDAANKIKSIATSVVLLGECVATVPGLSSSCQGKVAELDGFTLEDAARIKAHVSASPR